MPGLSELFYTGITGRGIVIGNPDLVSETSANFDTGLKIGQKDLFIGLYAFHYTIDDLIERYTLSKGIYTYGNIIKGKLKGTEIEIEYYPASSIKLFANGFLYSGKSINSTDYLNDVPPPRLYAGSRIWKNNVWLEVSTIMQKSHTHPGPAEIAIPGFTIINLEAGYEILPSLNVHLLAANLFNKEYLSRADPEAPPDPGRSISISLHYRW